MNELDNFTDFQKDLLRSIIDWNEAKLAVAEFAYYSESDIQLEKQETSDFNYMLNLITQASPAYTTKVKI
jgi:hypothetical protein